MCAKWSEEKTKRDAVGGIRCPATTIFDPKNNQTAAVRSAELNKRCQRLCLAALASATGVLAVDKDGGEFHELQMVSSMLLNNFVNRY